MIRAYRAFVSSRTDRDRQADGGEKTGVFTGAYAVNPASGARIPIFIADYVLMGYGTGAIMAVPGHDTRDLAFAEAFGLPVVQVVRPPEDSIPWRGYTAEGFAVNSGPFDGMPTGEAKRAIGVWLEEKGLGLRAVQYRLRDWLFSRQRYWGEPFPIVYAAEDGAGERPIALPESMLPVELPEMDDFRPSQGGAPDDPPRPPLGRAESWATVELDLGDGPRRYRRELNTMPQWAGSCWYYLRYLDPENGAAFVSPEAERYWMLTRHDGAPSQPGERFDPSSHRAGGVDLYVGGAEHAVLHLLYARFWHKVLFDLGHVSTPEPFHRLFNQGYIQAPAYTDDRGVYVEASRVAEDPPGSGRFVFEGSPVQREFGKMGKSLKNVVTPDDVCSDYGADTMRLYEMYMGPLEQSKPWNPRDIVGVHRFLQRVWRTVIDERTGAVRLSDDPADEATRRLVHRTIDGVRRDFEGLSFNTAIARLIELNNHLAREFGERPAPREAARAMALMLAPLTPHFAEELWSRMGEPGSVLRAPFPAADPGMLVESTVEMPVQIQGKVRSRVTVAAGADESAVRQAAMDDEKVRAFLQGRQVRKVIVVPGRMVNIVAD
jgi:leucyl-tRNA synthetase